MITHSVVFIMLGSFLGVTKDEKTGWFKINLFQGYLRICAIAQIRNKKFNSGTVA